MLTTLKFPFTFDAQRLRADLLKIADDEWIPHFNKSYYEGEWSAAALRSVGGSHTQIYPDPAAQEPFADTMILARCTHIRQVLKTFACPQQSVRLLRLRAGSSIREHKDYNLGFEDGEVRIHIPVCTDSAVHFFLDSKRILMNEGESWYLNFNLPHRVENYSTRDRIHLVIDCVVNDWLRSQFERARAMHGD